MFQGRTSRLLAFMLLLAAGGCNVQWVPVDPVKPDPNPPGPVVGERAFRLLIVEETEDRAKLPAAQQTIFASVPLRKYLRDHCHKLSDGSEGFRFVDKDQSGELPDELRKAADQPRQALPWLYVTDGVKGLSCPLPATVDDVLAKVKPYAEGTP